MAVIISRRSFYCPNFATAPLKVSLLNPAAHLRHRGHLDLDCVGHRHLHPHLPGPSHGDAAWQPVHGVRANRPELLLSLAVFLVPPLRLADPA